MSQAHGHVHARIGCGTDAAAQEGRQPAARHLVVRALVEAVLDRVLGVVEVHNELVVQDHAPVGEGVAFIDDLHDSAIAAVEGTSARAACGAKLAAGVHAQGGVLENVHVYVGPHVVPLVAGASLYAEVIGVLHDGLLVEVVEGNIVLDSFGTAGNAYVGTPLRGYAAVELCVGVRGAIVKGGAILELLFLGIREPGHGVYFGGGEIPVVLELPEVVLGEQVVEERRAAVTCNLVLDGLVPEQRIFIGRESPLHVCGICKAEVSGETNLGTSLLAAARGDDDYAVCGPDAVYRRGRSVFKHAYAKDVVGVHAVEDAHCLGGGLLDAVYYNKR